jgi:hypothetical protein
VTGNFPTPIPYNTGSPIPAFITNASAFDDTPYNATTGQAAIASSFVGTACVAVSALPTLTNGQVSPCLTDLFGNQYVNIGTPTVNAGTGFPTPIAYSAASPLPVTTAPPVSFPYTMATASPQAASANSAIGVVSQYTATSVSGSTGQLFPLQSNIYGYLRTVPCAGTSTTCATIQNTADAQANLGVLDSGSFNFSWNGASFDRNVTCDGNPAAVNITTATTTQIVALSGTTKIHVCSYQFSVAGTTPTVTFEYGTGTNCATGLTAISGAIAPTSGSVINSAVGGASGLAFVVPSGDALCILSGGTSPSIQGLITYAQY